MNFLAGGQPQQFLANGGLATVRSYLGARSLGNPLEVFREEFPDAHLKFLRSLHLFFEDDSTFVSHAGWDTGRPGDRNPGALTASAPEIFCVGVEPPRPLAVVGHYVQPDGTPHLSDHLIALDTGCGSLSGGPLTAVLLPERVFQQF
ncbi:hypothetical protein [Agrococcus sp. SGAir0287]|uniref:hypothetical protein n=1 Tax=Agrococcus sp. SGAir0287 TaxID=2070347 RepID=UPI0010F6FF78|nr:hypothetical protein [Agrococcus sp. SGAir0287]